MDVPQEQVRQRHAFGVSFCRQIGGCPAPNAANFKAISEDRVRLEVKLDIKVENSGFGRFPRVNVDLLLLSAEFHPPCRATLIPCPRYFARCWCRRSAW